MMKSLAISAVTLGVAATGAFAQSFSGGEVSLDYSTYTDGPDDGAVTLSGSAELAITREFGMQVDLSYTNTGEIFGMTDTSQEATSIVLHGIYNINASSSAGLFYGLERNDLEDGDDTASENTDFVGIELGYEVGTVAFEIYYAKPLDEIIDTASLYGISGAYTLSDAFAITGDADRLSDDAVSLTSVAVGVEYTAYPGITLDAEVGSANIDTGVFDSSETFIGLGATYTFGAERGATFDNRGLTKLLPDF